ncbi:MAG: hypothetical protein AAFR42_21040 [Cyanobacteria bacterium J06628_6]
MSDTPSAFDKAVAAYQDNCDRNDIPFQQPVEEYSKIIDQVVYLRARPASFVARYDIRRRRILV